jgi:hypothetical protein
MSHKRLKIGKERMLDGLFQKVSSQVKLILSPKQRAKPAASRTRTCAWICSNLVEKRSECPVVVSKEEVRGGVKREAGGQGEFSVSLAARTVFRGPYY